MAATAYRYVSPRTLLVEFFGAVSEKELSGMSIEEEFVLAVLVARESDEKIIVSAPRAVVEAAEPLMDLEREIPLHPEWL
jgi:hypothetical protein